MIFQNGPLRATLLRCLRLVLFTATVWSVEIVEHYDIRLKIHPEISAIAAETTMTIVAPEDRLQELVFTFIKDLAIKSISSDVGLSYVLKDKEPAPSRYADHAAPLIVRFNRALKLHESVRLKLIYAGEVKEHAWGVNVIKPDWVELGLYSGWFPFLEGYQSFNYDVEVRLDPKYRVAGGGDISGRGGTYKLKSAMRTSDIVVIGSEEAVMLGAPPLSS